MAYGPRDIEIVDALTLIRRRPDMYFPDGGPTMEALLAAVLEDAHAVEGDVRAARDGEFAMVASSRDWMHTDRAAFAALFTRFVIPAHGGINKHRAEVILSAVAAGVLTEGPCGDFAMNLARADLPATLLAQARPCARVLFWKFAGL